MASSFESRLHHQVQTTEISTSNESIASSANLLESVQEQQLQFSKLTQEIEEEKRAVQRQLEMESYAQDQALYHQDVYTHQETDEPVEETSVLIDEDGNQKTIKTKTVTKTITEQRFHHINNHGEPTYAKVNKNRRSDDEEVLLRDDSSSVRSDVMYATTPSASRYDDVRRQTPEKFQQEGYGLEDDNVSYCDEDGVDQYGLDARQTALKVTGSDTSSQSDVSRRYDGGDVGDEMPLAAPRGVEGDGDGRAPLAMQESGSRASLDGLGNGWHKPTLEEVVKMLRYNMKIVQENAAAYIQHLCFNNDQIKTEVRLLGGIPLLVRLLDHSDPNIQLNACGALRNLSFGSKNDANKIAIKECEGVPAVARLVRSTDNQLIKEQATGTLWNLSAHPQLKGQLLELGLEPLVNQIIVPHAEALSKGGKADNLRMVDLFTNAVGVIRNLSSTESSESRRKLRECRRLVSSLVTILQSNLDNGMISNKGNENSACVLRNLTFRLQEETPDYQQLYMLEGTSPAAQSRDSNTSGIFCFGSKPKSQTPDYSDQIPESLADAEGAELLWQPMVTQLYCELLLKSADNAEITEAMLGAIQNLTCGLWKWAVYARAVVRKEKVLPTIIDRMRTDHDRTVRAGTIALTNLSQDHKNKELIGKFAMKDLVYKLPGGSDPSVHHSDTTIIAVLNTIRALVDGNPDNGRHLRDSAGIERITTINRKENSPYHARVIKAAGQVLKAVWMNKSLHQMLKKDGWKKGHFQPTVTIETLPRRRPVAANSTSPSVTSSLSRRKELSTASMPVSGNQQPSNTADSWV